MKKQADSLSQQLNSATTWDTAISDAEKKILEAKEKISGLQKAIRIFKRLRERNEPFPGETFESETGLMSQEPLLGQRPPMGLCLTIPFCLFILDSAQQLFDGLTPW